MGAEIEFDFGGWATKNDLLCADGKTIRRDAFAHNDGAKVPLVWQHQHNDPKNVLGYAILKNHADGVRAYGYFNGTAAGKQAKEMVLHGDIDKLSIFANKLKKRGQDVLHGEIREVSLVLAGANPGALIDDVRIVHSDGEIEDLDDEAVIHTGLTFDNLDDEEEVAMADTATEERTLKEVYETMNDEQKNFVEAVLGMAFEDEDSSEDDSEEKEDVEHSDEGEDDDETIEHNNQEGTDMGTRNVFDQDTDKSSTLTHGQLQDFVKAVAEDCYKGGGAESLRDVMLAHADDYGITNIEELFPDAKNIDASPEWITRKMEWVETVLNGASKRPWSRLKSRTADLTHDEARAKGYIKGSMKKEQFFAVAHRETGPTTIYKKQKLDRDDIIDITDFDVVAWIWVEMRFMLREEIARAVLIGDGREIDDEDKIDENKIRPIAQDDEFYTDVVTLDANVTGEALIEAVLRQRPKYKGVGNPTAFTTEDILTDLLLIKDKLGRRLYPTESELATALRVKNIVSVPVMEGATRDGGEIQIILVNMGDYTIGTDKGGQISTFDDFDIDFNQYKYLIEGRMSGSLMAPKRAQVFIRDGGTEVTPTVPTFNASTGVVTIPSVAGVTYYKTVVGGDDVELESGAQTAISAGSSVEIYALPDEDYFFPHNFDADWEFTRDA